MNFNLIKKLMNSLNLGEVIGEPMEVKGGLLHKMFRVCTSSGSYAVKVLNSEIMKRPTALNNTINSEKIAALFADSIPVVAALTVDGKQIHEKDGCHYMVFNWIDGKSIFAPDIYEKHCVDIGDILGKMHSLNIIVDGVVSEEAETSLYEWEKYLQLAKGQDITDKVWMVQYEKSLNDIIEWNKQVCQVQENLVQNQVISHRDLDPKNVMWNNDTPFLIDWEAAGYVNPYQELLEVINYWVDDGKGNLDKSYFDAIVKAYGKHMKLADVEWDEVLAGSYMGMLGWLEYNVKRSVGIEVSGDEEIKDAEQQVIGTIKELYYYQKKAKLLKEWLEHDR